MTRIILVDEHDNPIGFKERADRTATDIIRITGLCVYNSKNEILIAKRVATKRFDPGKWGPAVAGTVDEGESYLSNIIKEAKEELGLVIETDKLVQGPCKRTPPGAPYFLQRFFYKADLPIESFVIEKSEVAEIRWIALGDLEQWIIESPEEIVAALQGPESMLSDFKMLLGEGA